MNAHARNSDPVTSHEAAAGVSVENQSASQQAVLTLLRRFGPMTDVEMIARYEANMSPRFSESRLRTARKELVDRGFVEAQGMSHAGPRRMTIWAAVTKNVQFDLFGGVAA